MSSDLKIYPLKRGATLSLGGTKTLPSGDWSSSTAQVRRITTDGSVGALVDDLTLVVTPPVAPATLSTILLVGTSAQTIDWPLEKLQCDLRFSDASDPPVVLPTDTFLIDLAKEITRVV